MGHYALPFGAGFAASFAVILFFLRSPTGSKTTARRLEGIKERTQTHVGAADRAELEKEEPWGYSEWLELLLERYAPGKNIKLLLLHANSNMSLSGFVVASTAAGLGGGLLCWLVSRSELAAAAVALAAACGPCILLRIRRGRRLKAFNAALPDAIDLMARCLVAGHSIGSSIEMIGQQAPQPLGFEFVQVYQQQRLGLQFRDALLQMGSRVPSRDLQFLITAILVQKETGGDLTEILSRASHVIRERVRIQGEVRTRTAQGRLTGWILGLLPVVMLGLINIISPGYSNVLFHDPVGKELLCTGAVMITMGALVIRRIVNVQV